MAVSGNLPPNENINSTTNYFNNYFTDNFTVSPNVNDAVVGYFQGITGDVDTGKNLAASIIYTALSQGLDPMSLVDEFRRLKAGNILEQKTPIDSSGVISFYSSFNEINQNKNAYEVGTLFYVIQKNLFYVSILEQNEILQIISAPNYKAEKINVGNDQYAYNYFYVTVSQERDDLTPYLTVLLNYNRVGTSLLGISNQALTNKYVQRSIRA
jgi:hypothetical protein